MNTRQCKISVIVPIYNVEPYLRQCIDSILAQTYTNFELILVDDGSPDNCGAICHEYAMQDNRVVVLHQENGGLSAARNAGIDWVFSNSDSQWITFVDSDDCIRPQLLEHLLSAATTSGVLLSIGILDVYSQTPKLETVFADDLDIRIMEGRELCKSLYRDERIISIGANGKLYHRDLFREFRFALGKIHEDQDLVPRLIYTAGRAAVVSNPYYCYFVRPGSIMHQAFSLRRFDNVDGINACIRFYESQADEELVQLATEVRERIWTDCLLGAWKRGLWREIPREHRPPFLKGCKIFAKGLCKKLQKRV